MRDIAIKRRRSRDTYEMVEESSESQISTPSRTPRLTHSDKMSREINFLEESEKSRIKLQIRNEERERK